MTSHVTLAAILVVSSVSAALIVLAAIALVIGWRGSAAPPDPNARQKERAVFLFDDDGMIDATPAAQAILEKAPVQGSDRDRLAAFLVLRFPDFERRIAELPQTGRIRMDGLGPGPVMLEAERLGGVTRIELIGGNGDEPEGMDPLSRRADAEELRELREVVANTPALAWRLDAEGNMTWANRAYFARAAAHLGEPEDSLSWPLPHLIDPGEPPFQPGSRRVGIASAQPGAARWYDLWSFPSDNGSLHFAAEAEGTVKAESALREFVQTLTKTFAHLPIGLAIFDRQRKLALFNPAMIDLTTLGADFLSARPTLFSFLDRLREARMMPEPKDYPTWRRRMAELEKAATSGLYHETWTLPSGQTYRVTGRPHPDGAVAFFFEDISAEISLSRRFRSELELGQGVLDRLDDAVAVFSPAGTLALSNSAYARLWGSDPATTFASIGVREAMALWQSRTAASDVWAGIADYLNDTGNRADRTVRVATPDGTQLDMRLRPMAGGATVVVFHEIREAERSTRRAAAAPGRPRLAPAANAAGRAPGDAAGR